MSDSQIPDEAEREGMLGFCERMNRYEGITDGYQIHDEPYRSAVRAALTAAYSHLIAENTRLRAKLDTANKAADAWYAWARCWKQRFDSTAALDEEGTIER